MKTVLVTGGIASGKSTVCKYLASLGYPVYDCDSRCKGLYDTVPGLKRDIEAVTGFPFSRLGEVFGSPDALRALEELVYPLLLEDIEGWKAELDRPLCFIESAVALSKPLFDDAYDIVLLVDSDYARRLERNPKVASRAPLQHTSSEIEKANFIISNNSTKENLYSEVDEILKTIENEN